MRTNRDKPHRCLRCGISVYSGCCRDCRAVDARLCDELIAANSKRRAA